MWKRKSEVRESEKRLQGHLDNPAEFFNKIWIIWIDSYIGFLKFF